MFWNKFLCIFGITYISNMKTYERIVRDKDGNDIGVRENDRGAIYINHEVFFKNEKTIKVVEDLRNSEIIRDIRQRRDKSKLV